MAGGATPQARERGDSHRGSLGMGPGMGIESAQRTGNQSFLESFSFARPKVLVVGCGGAGGNSVHRLHRLGIHGARTVVVNTDAVHLDSIQADRKLLIGAGVTRGMGAGGRPEIGERCAEISETELRNQIGDADLTFITVGLGGGTGTGVAPHVAELAQAAGSVVITLATTPFRAERGRMTNARAGIQRLRDRTDSLILLDNNRLLDLVPNLPVEQAFAVMDHLIGEVIKGITESITVPSLINLDFSDVRTILQSGGTSTVFYGENAEDDTRRVVSDTLDNPLLEVDYRGANGALIHISAGPGLRLRTAHEVVEGLTAAMRPDANVIFGVRVDPKYNGILRVLAIMTGVRSPMVESVRESVSVADVVSDRSDPLAKDFPRPDRRR
ncbi:MAG: cell division protein FtsZ [Methanobacteriota archaeon]|nr:MAG: cell division protein FtsZ [Euryarchaeota archaeon]